MQETKPTLSPAPTPKKADVTRSQILLAAAQLFSQKGYAASTLREVAKMANVKAGSVYYHFESKEQILDEVLNTGIQIIMKNVTSALASLPANASFRERLTAAVRAHLRTMVLKDSEYTTAYMRIYSQLPPVIKRRSREMRKAYGKMWHDMFAQAQADGEISPDVNIGLMTSFLLGGLNRTQEWFDSRRTSLEELVQCVITLTLDGIGATGAQRSDTGRTAAQVAHSP